MAAALGAAYTLAGRLADAIPLLTQAMEQTTAVEMVGFQALCSLPLGEAHLLAGRLEEAQALAEQALTLTRAHQERGNEAYALRLLGEIAARRDPPEAGLAVAHYRRPWPSPTNWACARSWPTATGGSARCMPQPISRSRLDRAVHCLRTVPGHGHGILAAPGGGCTDAGGGTVAALVR